VLPSTVGIRDGVVQLVSEGCVSEHDETPGAAWTGCSEVVESRTCPTMRSWWMIFSRLSRRCASSAVSCSTGTPVHAATTCAMSSTVTSAAEVASSGVVRVGSAQMRRLLIAGQGEGVKALVALSADKEANSYA
jgi:hypothetical protein